jgi:osmoprotectant transport system substrate-binding protein
MFKQRVALFAMLSIFFFLAAGCGTTGQDIASIPTSTIITLPTAISTPATNSVATPVAENTPKQVKDVEEKSEEEPNKTIVVGSKAFTEQLLLGQMLSLILQDAGYEVVDQSGLGESAAVREALESGDIDIYWEYTGTALSLYHELPTSALHKNAQTTYTQVKSLDERHHDLIWLEPAELNNTYALIMQDKMLKKGIESIEDLASVMNQDKEAFKLCVASDFYAREEDGLFALEEYYDLNFKDQNILVMELDRAYRELRDGNCDVAEAFSTDGRIYAWDFSQLQDTKGFFPFYTPAPVIRQEILQKYPEIEALLSELAPTLDNKRMRQLNARVDLGADGKLNSGDEEAVEVVARDFLSKAGLLGVRPQLVVGSKLNTEELLLGQILISMLEEAGYDVINKTGLGGSPVVRAALLNGDIDLYVEFTGTALSVYHELPASALPDNAKGTYDLAKSLDKGSGIVWLERGTFNNTYTLMISDELFEDGIQTIPDLADYINKDEGPSLTVCVETEFYGRPQDGLFGMLERYDFNIKDEDILVVPLDALYQGLRDGTCDVAQGFATDGRIKAWSFSYLEDTLSFFPIYNPAIVTREEVLEEHPTLKQFLNQLAPHLDDHTISQLNARVDIGPDNEFKTGDEESLEDVAEAFLCQIDLLDDCATIEPIVVKIEEEEEALESNQSCENLILNGEFESEEAWIILQTELLAKYTRKQAHNGKWAASFGDPEEGDLFSYSVMTQNVALPEEARTATLTFSYYPFSEDLSAGDTQGVMIYDATLSVQKERLLWDIGNQQEWITSSYDLTDLLGQEIALSFTVINDGDGLASSMYVDDVTLEVCYDE